MYNNEDEYWDTSYKLTPQCLVAQLNSDFLAMIHVYIEQSKHVHMNMIQDAEWTVSMDTTYSLLHLIFGFHNASVILLHEEE